MRTANDIEHAMSTCADAVWRVCAIYFRCEADIQDAFQETFLRYCQADNVAFSDDEHRKAWLIKVARTRCLDVLKSAARKNTISGDDALLAGEPYFVAGDPSEQPGSFANEVLDALQKLDDPPRTPVFLAICEEYTAPEIAEIVDAPVGTVYSWISRGKQLLREALS